jgi:general secretion pathway protein B
MSYILDALRKADAERERGAVPDLHAQLLPPGATEVEPEPPRSTSRLWIGVGVVLAAAAGASWWALSDREAAEPPVVSPAPREPAAAMAPAASARPALANAGAAAPAAAPPPVPAPVLRSEAAEALPGPKAATKAKPAASAPAVAAALSRPKVAMPAQVASAPVPQAPPPAARLPSLAELPGDLRQQVPPLVMGGSVYSPQASVRMVIVNGQVFQEGNSLAPELKLEQIRPKTAVFSIRGQRFEVPL